MEVRLKDPDPDPAGERARLLELTAEHRFISFAQAQALLQTAVPRVRAHLRELESSGLIRRERPFGGRHSFFLITAAGLREAGSRLGRPRFRLGSYEHDLGVAWLWLAARTGAFGALGAVISERSMRSQDATTPGEQPLAVRLPGLGAGGRQRLHYPDLLLITPEGKRVAVELELSAKGRARRERILGGYAADVRIDAVLYLVRSRSLGDSIRSSAHTMGIGHLVHVQMARLEDVSGPSAGAQRVVRRATARAEPELTA